VADWLTGPRLLWPSEGKNDAGDKRQRCSDDESDGFRASDECEDCRSEGYTVRQCRDIDCERGPLYALNGGTALSWRPTGTAVARQLNFLEGAP
jgi:hypothetical protein